MVPGDHAESKRIRGLARPEMRIVDHVLRLVDKPARNPVLRQQRLERLERDGFGPFIDQAVDVPIISYGRVPRCSTNQA